MRLGKIAMLATMLSPLASYATLGGAPSAGTPTQTMLRAAPQSAAGVVTASAAAPYITRETRDSNGVTIREYVLSSNIVFAVTWEGPIRPDMTALLGSYFPNFVAAGESRARGTGPLIESNGDFRIESAGRLGHFFGMAYLPRLMPANVRPGDLK
ncbi:DUF2844 domain-containing protein [Paraburkholderia sp. IW21]|uniref:DUF2844 domain-containing protein n=1 Tax=Paraburkholderia sp. IW21 TaxID=3242488 RepID=UPI00351FBF68